MEQQSPVLIIGGGIAGLALAIHLKRVGVSSRVFEAYPEPATIGGGFQIAPNGMRVLASLGIADRFAAVGTETGVFCFRNHHGRIVGRVDLTRAGVGVIATRRSLQELLIAAAAREGVTVEYGKRVAALEQDDRSVVARFDDGTAACGDVLFGADGVHSRIRGAILPDFAQPRYTGVIAVGGFVAPGAPLPSDPRDAHQLNFMMGARLQFGYGMLNEQTPRWGWWSHLPQERELTRRELQAIADSELQATLLREFRGWSDPVEPFLRATSQILRTAVYDVPQLPTWHVGRVMLLGDAAHAMSPAGGQGASLALEDAMAIAREIARTPRDIDRAFAEVERRLRRRAEGVVAQARSNDERQLQTLGPFGQWARDRLFPLFAPLIGRQLERLYAGVDGLTAA